MADKHIWVCEDCLSENLEKKPKTEDVREWVSWGTGDIENYCLDCESFTYKTSISGINKDGLIIIEV